MYELIPLSMYVQYQILLKISLAGVKRIVKPDILTQITYYWGLLIITPTC